MTNIIVSLFTCVLLSSVAFLSMLLHPRLAERYLDNKTAETVGRIANIFVVITSLVFGLLITSSKATFESVDRNIHNYATELILLDRIFRNYGADAVDSRKALKAYVREAIAHPAQTDDLDNIRADTAGNAMDNLGKLIALIRPADSFHEDLLADIRSHYRDVVRQRWIIVEQSEGTIPTPLICVLIAWLTIIFASYGFRAPGNVIVILMVIISAMLISASLYLVLDMNRPFKGLIRISYQPYHRALAEIEIP